MHDIIVIGAGPAGSFTAGKLAGRGHSVAVLERRRQVGEKVCCTGIIGQECADAFDIETSVILKHVNSARLFSPSGHELHVQRAEPQACILDRTAFDISMAERARKAGAEYIFDCTVNRLGIEKDRVTVETSRAGNDVIFEARAAVIASGFSPALLERTGLGGYGDFTVGAQTEVEAPGVNEVEVYFGEVSPGFFGWLVPAVRPLVRVGLLSRRSPGPFLKKWLDELKSRGRITSTEGKISYGGIPLKPPARTYGERLLAVGDAAGQVKPTSGGGIYFGLLSAEIAARTLHHALEDDDLSAGRLARYERGWRRKLGRELRVGYWTRKLFERLGDGQLDRIFRIVKANGIDEALLRAEELSFDWHSRTVLSLVRYQVVSSLMGVIKLPFRSL